MNNSIVQVMCLFTVQLSCMHGDFLGLLTLCGVNLTFADELKSVDGGKTA